MGVRQKIMENSSVPDTDAIVFPLCDISKWEDGECPCATAVSPNDDDDAQQEAWAEADRIQEMADAINAVQEVDENDNRTFLQRILDAAGIKESDTDTDENLNRALTQTGRLLRRCQRFAGTSLDSLYRQCKQAMANIKKAFQAKRADN